MDTEALTQCAREALPLFTKPLCELQVPLLLTGSAKDQATFPNDPFDTRIGIDNCETTFFKAAVVQNIQITAGHAFATCRWQQYIRRQNTAPKYWPLQSTQLVTL